MKTTFLRALEAEDKAAAVLSAIRGPNIKRGRHRFEIDPAAFASMPGSPFAYWAPTSLVEWFANWPSLKDSGYEAMTGAKTNDDGRFLRLMWEVRADQIGASRDDTRHGRGWVHITRGGPSSRFYYNIDSVIEWANDGHCLKAYISEYRGKRGWGYQWSANLNGYDWYFQPGLTWPLRGVHLSVWPVPQGCMPSGAGKMVFAPFDHLPGLLATTNSAAFDAALRVFAGKVGGVQYEAGLIQQIPIPSMSDEDRALLGDRARRSWSLKRSLDMRNEPSHAFVLPGLLQIRGSDLRGRISAVGKQSATVQAELADLHAEIDDLCFELYGISDEDRRAIIEGFDTADDEPDGPGDNGQNSDVDAATTDPVGLAEGLVSWAVGVAAGRFDVRLATGELEWPEEPAPFDPLPACSPAMLVGGDGLPEIEAPAEYPVSVSPVLVDDSGHRLDITGRTRAVFEAVFGDDADRWWSEVGATLGPRGGEVSAWLRRGFFDYHLRTYSKSRRKAPILWPIGTRSGSYQVWLYAHRVSQDTLFQVLNDLVAPKVTLEEQQLTRLRQDAGPDPTASQRKVIDKQEGFVSELRELKEAIEGAAPLWAPDLNDGIVIVLAPLWDLFAHHREWSKELKQHWDKLVKGEYDWAQLAIHLWPERVILKCAEDRSIAIAHGLEEVFWCQEEATKERWHPREYPVTRIEELVAQRQNPAVAAALRHLANA